MLTAKQEKAVAAVLTARTLEAAAAEVGVTARTLRTWRGMEEFKDELHRRSVELMDEAADALRASVPVAVLALRDIAADEEETAYNRTAAASRLLEFASRLEVGKGEAEEAAPVFIFQRDAPSVELHRMERREEREDEDEFGLPRLILGSRRSPEVVDDIDI